MAVTIVVEETRSPWTTQSSGVSGKPFPRTDGEESSSSWTHSDHICETE